MTTYFDKKTIIKTDKSFLDIYYIVDNKEYKHLVKSCIEDIKDKLKIRPEIKIYGKTCHQARDVGFFSDSSIGYQYSGQIAKSQKLTPNLKQLLDQINLMFNANFNGILINRYNNGLEYIGRHSDDEHNLDKQGVVAISYGTERKFRVNDKVSKKKVVDVMTRSCSIIHMGGDFQKEFTHEILKDTKITNCRYSLTFRSHLE